MVPEISDVSLQLGTTVAAGDVAEGCAEATSGVDLLRFGALSRNVGTADSCSAIRGCPSPCTEHPLEVCGNPDFVCSPAAGHNHPHYANYARYELLDANGQAIVVGHKQGYCLRDTNCADPFYTCANQGISAGLRRRLRRDARVPVPRHHRRARRHVSAAGDGRSVEPDHRALRGRTTSSSER